MEKSVIKATQQDSAADNRSEPEPARFTGVSLAGFRIAAAAVQGPGHVRQSAPCDDRFSVSSTGARICAVVCDGAGSASMGRVGAERASQALSGGLLEALSDAELTSDGVCEAILARLEIVRCELVSDHPERKLSDFHATVVGAVWDTSSGVLFHIGDGVAAAISEATTLETHDAWGGAQISDPENGEFSEETYFFTMDPVRLRLLPFSDPTAIVLMTDGAAGIAYTNSSRSLEGGFYGPIAGYWSRVSDPQKVAEQLAKLMRSTEADSRNDDDKCMLIALKEACLESMSIGNDG